MTISNGPRPVDRMCFISKSTAYLWYLSLCAGPAKKKRKTKTYVLLAKGCRLDARTIECQWIKSVRFPLIGPFAQQETPSFVNASGKTQSECRPSTRNAAWKTAAIAESPSIQMPEPKDRDLKLDWMINRTFPNRSNDAFLLLKAMSFSPLQY